MHVSGVVGFAVLNPPYGLHIGKTTQKQQARARHLVQVNQDAAPVAPFYTSEQLVPALRTVVACLFFENPFLGSPFFPVRYCSKDDLLSHWQRKVVEELAGEIIALMTACIAFALDAHFDRASVSTRQELII